MSQSLTSTPRLSARIGLVLAALLGLADVVTNIPLFADDPLLASVGLVLGVVTLGALPFAWRDAGWARVVVIASRLLSSLLGLPAFFVADVPAGWIAAAAGGMLLAVLVAVLILVGSGTRRA